MFERLVVAYDGSKPAGGAAELAFELARRRGAQLTLACVLELLDPIPTCRRWRPGSSGRRRTGGGPAQALIVRTAPNEEAG
jgi:nucleotide-binding universal stress UspA family protein